MHDELNVQSVSNNQVNHIIKDRTGVLWVATENGVSYICSKSTSFNSIALGNHSSNITSVSKKKNITTISKFDDNKIWIGTANGLYLLANIETDARIQKLPEFSNDHIWSLTSMNETKFGLELSAKD